VTAIDKETYRLTFINNDPFGDLETMDWYQIIISDASGNTVSFDVTLGSNGEPNNPNKPTADGIVIGLTSTAFITESGAFGAAEITFEITAVMSGCAIGALYWTPAVFIAACLAIVEVHPEINDPSNPAANSVTVAATGYATVAQTYIFVDRFYYLLTGFTNVIDGVTTGFGWALIHILLPSVTFSLINEILTYGTPAADGIYTVISYEKVVSGITKLYQLITMGSLIFTLYISEVVIDGWGHEIIIEDENLAAHFLKHAAELLLLGILTEAAYKSKIKQIIENPDEVWTDTTGDKSYKTAYVQWILGGRYGLVVFVSPKDWPNKDIWLSMYPLSRKAIEKQCYTGGPFDLCLYPTPPPR
jgi:hypothetical protein